MAKNLTEIFGLPGAGKSYIAQKYSSAHNIALISASGLNDFIFAFVFAISHPRASLFFFKTLLRETRADKSLRRHKLRMILIPALAKDIKAIAEPDALIDQGLAQLLLSLYEREISLEEATRALQSFPKNSRKILFVEAPGDVRMRRMEERGRVARGFLGSEYISRWYPIVERNYEIIKSAIIKSGVEWEVVENSF